MASYDDDVNSVLEQVKQDMARRWPKENPTPIGLRTPTNRKTNLGMGSQPTAASEQPINNMVDVPDYATLHEALRGVGVRPDTIQTLTNPSKDMVLDTAGLPVDWKTRVSNVYDYNKANDVISNWGVTKKIPGELSTEQPLENNGVVEALKGGVYTDRPEWHTTSGGVERGLAQEALRVATQQGDIEGTEKATVALKNIAESEAVLIPKETKPSYHYETDAQGNVSIYKDGELVKGSGVGKREKPDKPEKPDKLNLSDVKSAYSMDMSNIKNQLMIDMTPEEQANLAGQPAENVLALVMSGRVGKSLSPEKKAYYLNRLKKTEDYYGGLTNQVLGRKGVGGKVVTNETPTNITYGQLWNDVSNVKTSSAGVKLLKEKYGYSEQQAKQIINQGIKSGRIK